MKAKFWVYSFFNISPLLPEYNEQLIFESTKVCEKFDKDVY